MSGHSKWHNIAKRKGANDAKKAKIFTKIGREMAIAIKEGGSANPDNNSRLRDVIAKAKANNMPNDNIKRTLDKYSGANGTVEYESINYEGYGVGGVAVIVETLTDNRNRTASDVRHLLDKFGAGMGATGCVGWQFDQKGVLIIEKGDLDEDETMMLALDAGAEDFRQMRRRLRFIRLLRTSAQCGKCWRRRAWSLLRPKLRWCPKTILLWKRKRTWLRCASCSTTSRTTTMCRQFGTTGRTRTITKDNRF